MHLYRSPLGRFSKSPKVGEFLIIGAVAPFYLTILLWTGYWNEFMPYPLLFEEFLKGVGLINPGQKDIFDAISR